MAEGYIELDACPQSTLCAFQVLLTINHESVSSCPDHGQTRIYCVAFLHISYMYDLRFREAWSAS